jgi:hypothetical protein
LVETEWYTHPIPRRTSDQESFDGVHMQVPRDADLLGGIDAGVVVADGIQWVVNQDLVLPFVLRSLVGLVNLDLAYQHVVNVVGVGVAQERADLVRHSPRSLVGDA